MIPKRTTEVVAGSMILAIVCLVGMAWYRLAHRFSFNDRYRLQMGTFVQLLSLAGALDSFVEQTGQYPSNIMELMEWEELGKHSTFNGDTQDAFGQEVIYNPYTAVSGHGSVISLGHDGMPGGQGPDRDLEIRFPLKENELWNEKVHNEVLGVGF